MNRLDTIDKKESIQNGIREAYDGLINEIDKIKTDRFYLQSDGKWSVAENLQHLILSTKPIIKCLNAPREFLKTFGVPNRAGRAIQEIKNKYEGALAKAGNVSVPNFTPRSEDIKDMDALKKQWLSLKDQLIEAVGNWEENEFDEYIIPHPLLGKMTVREMLLFTILHTYHHQKAIVKYI